MKMGDKRNQTRKLQVETRTGWKEEKKVETRKRLVRRKGETVSFVCGLKCNDKKRKETTER